MNPSCHSSRRIEEVGRRWFISDGFFAGRVLIVLSLREVAAGGVAFHGRRWLLVIAFILCWLSSHSASLHFDFHSQESDEESKELV